VNPFRNALRCSSIGLFASCVFLLAGCTVGPKYRRPSVPTPPAYKETGTWRQAQPNEKRLGGNWWELFNDPLLNSLEAQINVSNQNLMAAEAQFRQARAVFKYDRAEKFPTVTAGASAIRSRVSANRPPQTSIFNGRTNTDFVLPFDLSYQIDAWGRVRRQVESAQEQAQASAADVATVSLSMHADLAVDYFQARSLDAQEQLLKRTVIDYEKALELTQNRFHGGVATILDVEQAQTQLETTRAQAIDVGVARAQFEHALAVLIGKPPAEITLPPMPLAAVPPTIPVGLPSELLQRRPDIAAAERRVASANAQIGVARTAYYPNISLGASGGFESGVITTLLSGPSVLWSVGPTAVMTLFDGGRRRAVNDQAQAAYDLVVANYRQTTLTAFQQVEDNVAALRILEQEAQVQANATAAAQRALTTSETRYRGGVTTYLEVITSQNAALANEVASVNILGRRMSNTVLLIQALGGGWDASQLPTNLSAKGQNAAVPAAAIGTTR
jgi:NodT family efflux transporter outer membrane factor (OMF) lipoprotein